MFTGVEDLKDAPMEEKSRRLPWYDFNSDFYSSDRKFEEVKGICKKYPYKVIDLRPYMVRYPYSVQSTDNLYKC